MADEKKKTSAQEDMAKLKAQRLAKATQGAGGAGILQFFKETWTELKKTTWPDQNTLTKSTMIVLAFILAAAAWVGGIDKLVGTIQHNF